VVVAATRRRCLGLQRFLLRRCAQPQ